jgi:hypothetical protein
MPRTFAPKPVIAAGLCAAVITTSALPAAAVTPHRHGGPGGGGSDAPAPAAGRLPANWPKDVPVPPGQIRGTNVSAAHAVVQLLVSGSAAQALRSVSHFYRVRGFAGRGALLHRGTRRLTIVVENRDHSNAHTFVVIDASRS